MGAGRAAPAGGEAWRATAHDVAPRGGARGFDAHKRIKGRKRRILVDILGLPFASRVEPAGVSDRVAGRKLVGGLRFAFPELHAIIADAGHESRKLARELKQQDGSIVWLHRNRRSPKTTSAACGRPRPWWTSQPFG